MQLNLEEIQGVMVQISRKKVRDGCISYIFGLPILEHLLLALFHVVYDVKILIHVVQVDLCGRITLLNKDERVEKYFDFIKIYIYLGSSKTCT